MGRGDQTQWNKSQIAKSNAGLSAAGGYGATAAGESPTAGYKDIYANPMSPEERAGRLSATGGAYDAMATKAGERTAATRNSAGYGELLDELARGKSRAMGETTSALDTEAFNRKMGALGGLGRQYGTDVGAQTELLRPGQPNFSSGFWDKFLLTAMGNANKAAEQGGAGV
jgi:hypothetical protein